jgi:DNA polymerase III subunit gamma/tau
MAQYQSIYRKWRPQFFEDIIGQEHITRTLRNAIKRNRIAHAYIFSGPRGVGKTTTARIMAKALNCQEGPTDHPCNKCYQCIRINSGQSMDVVEIDGASNRGIDEIRELRSKIGFAPAEGKYKVYIIDEVHMLTNEAFNALLKTLEEPPNQVLFIFATTAPQKVPKTILSRCQCFHFRRISVDEIVGKLKKITEEEKLDIDTPSLYLIAESATGSLRDAESILDQVITYSGEQVTHEDVKEMLGIIPQRFFLQLIQAIAARNTKAGLELVDQLVKEGIDLHQFVQDMIVYTHQLSLIKILGKDYQSSSLVEKDDSGKILELVGTIDLKKILNIVEELNQIEDKIKNHQYPWVLLELLIVKGTQVETQNQEKKIDDKTISKEREIVRQAGKLYPERDIIKKKELPQNNTYTISTGQGKCQFDEWWPKVLSRIKNEKISLYAFLLANSKIYLEDDQLMVFFRRDSLFHKESLEKRENKELVEGILEDESKLEIKLKCFIDENSTEVSSHFNLERNKGKIAIEQSIDHDLDLGKGKKKTENMDKDSLSTTEILEKARDLFGGNISED